jgi:hypothetical protein
MTDPNEIDVRLEHLESQIQNARIAAGELEGRKLMVDVAKHLTTLSSGSTLLLTTLLKDIFKGQVQGEWLRAPILLAFLLSLLFAVAVAWLVPLVVIYRSQPKEDLTLFQRLELYARKLRPFCYRLAVGRFFVGVLLLLIFGMINF